MKDQRLGYIFVSFFKAETLNINKIMLPRSRRREGVCCLLRNAESNFLKVRITKQSKFRPGQEVVAHIGSIKQVRGVPRAAHPKKSVKKKFFSPV